MSLFSKIIVAKDSTSFTNPDIQVYSTFSLSSTSFTLVVFPEPAEPVTYILFIAPNTTFLIAISNPSNCIL